MLESLCCGTPVISFSVGGMKEEIETGVNGVLCGDVSAENLKQGITDFINGKYHFDNVAISERAHLKYSENNIAEQYKQVYLSIANKD
jgi:glycosyltransferase involved in cell wall biosynthesis